MFQCLFLMMYGWCLAQYYPVKDNRVWGDLGDGFVHLTHHNLGGTDIR